MQGAYFFVNVVQFCIQHVRKRTVLGSYLMYKEGVFRIQRKAVFISQVNYDCCGFALPRFMIGLKISRHLFNQSQLERFSIECRETKTKVIALTNHNSRKQSNEPIRA